MTRYTILRAMPIGREEEAEEIDRLLDLARAGRKAMLVLRGPAGIGKSELLRYAAGRANDMLVLRAHGVEAESELAFAGLLELLRPVIDRVERLPGPQAAALHSALALGSGAAGSRFATSAAVLALLAMVAEEQPVLCLVDDAHWLDSASTEALLFAGRRLDADPAMLLFAAREGFDARGIAERELTPLPSAAAARLLGTPPHIAQRLVEWVAGNPLALIEVGRALSQRQLQGADPLPEPLPAPASAARAFEDRIARLSEPARRALTLAAAGSEELGPIIRAAENAGIAPAALEEAETNGLVEIHGGQLQFAHPLARSAALAMATPAQRRATHRALAAVTQPEPAAWHLAAAAFGPDEEAAAALEAAAARAHARSGYAAAAAALDRASQLTPDPAKAAERRVAAAEAARLAGHGRDAARLLDEALRTAPADLQQSITHSLGRLELTGGRPAAARAALSAPDASAAMLADAGLAAILTGDAAGALALAEQARDAQPSDANTQLIVGVVLAHALQRAGRGAETRELIAGTIARIEGDSGMLDGEYVVHAASLFSWTGDHDRARRILRRVIARARDERALGLLPWALWASSDLDTRTGRWNTAYADAAEAATIAADVRLDLWRCYALGCLALIEAARGREQECRASASKAIALAADLSVEVPRKVHDALGLLELGLGRPEAALVHLTEVMQVDGRLVPRLSVADLLEALVRVGRPPSRDMVAAGTASSWSGSSASAALRERCYALIAPDDEIDRHFPESLRHYDATEMPFARARTALTYGERLRRAGRRVESRAQLRAALEVFARLGADPWTRRAEQELRATGEIVRRRDPTDAEELTPQELQIARIVANGATNREAGAALFLSPKTIEYHLAHVYRKLSVRSRTELARHAGLTVAAL